MFIRHDLTDEIYRDRSISISVTVVQLFTVVAAEPLCFLTIPMCFN